MPASPLLFIGVVALLLLAEAEVVAVMVAGAPPEVVKMEERRDAADVLAKIGPMPMAPDSLPSELVCLMVLGLDEGEGEEDRPGEE
jgi:hypothetical protein